MKIKSVILACLFTLSFFSCSMEDENVLIDMDRELSNTDKGDSAMAALTVNVFVNQLATKAVPTEGETTEHIKDTEAINDCSIILLGSDNKVIDARDNVSVKEIAGVDNKLAVNTKFALKQQNDLKVVVIANTSQSFAACNSMDDINVVVQNAKDLGTLVKMGIKDGISTENKTYDNPENVSIELHQLAARIELASFNITKKSFSKTLPVDVTLTKVTLLNVNNGCKTILTNNEDNTIGSSNVKFGKENISVYKGATESNIAFTEENKPIFYSFPKTVSGEDKVFTEGNKSVTMKIEFKVGDIAYTKYYKIQYSNGTSSVKSGYLYRLNVNMTAESNEVEFDVTCSVNDWNNNIIEIPMEDM